MADARALQWIRMGFGATTFAVALLAALATLSFASS